MEKAFLTDAVLLYAPSQVALAAVLHAASKLQENLDKYVTDTLFGVDGQGKLEELIEAVRGTCSISIFCVEWKWKVLCSFIVRFIFRNKVNGKIR